MAADNIQITDTRTRSDRVDPKPESPDQKKSDNKVAVPAKKEAIVPPGPGAYNISRNVFGRILTL